ncbi:MAG: purine-nucleoside phosphorylase [Pirellula sp.]|jgi:purine-nucleoside phosphorylase|nr:purine-nucleoside phosphorylase [Pirellula sp.]
MDIPSQVQQSVSFIHNQMESAGVSGESRHFGLILGSGLGSLAHEIEDSITIPYAKTPGFPLSHVSGHAGNLVLGRIGQTKVVALAGRSHLYEGWASQHATLPVRVLAGLGVKNLVVSNASGGINPRFRSGQVVLIDQHIDGMRRSPFTPEELATQKAASDQSTAAMRAGHHGRLGSTYDENLMKQAERVAISLGFSLQRGTYLATLGPTYETRAEYRMFARMGADMVGMSTVPEVLVARSLGVRVLAFSIVTNVATPDAPTKTDHSEVLDWSKQAQSQLVPLIKTMLTEPQADLLG